MSALRLVIFDVDGTLVDSQATICAAMARAYEGRNMVPPEAGAVRAIVGLSLPEAVARLSPGLEPAECDALAAAYRDAYFALRAEQGSAAISPLFPGAREVLEQFRAQDHTLLAVATGKSRRGLSALIEEHRLGGLFQSLQTSDTHPSKPHPAMLHQVLSETGVDAARAVMVGDTTFDMEMGRAAGTGTVGVGWGYHAAADLGADRVIGQFAELPGAVDELLGQMA